jgi:hypothetical protein
MPVVASAPLSTRRASAIAAVLTAEFLARGWLGKDSEGHRSNEGSPNNEWSARHSGLPLRLVPDSEPYWLQLG